MSSAVHSQVDAHVSTWFERWGTLDRDDILHSVGCEGDDAAEFFEDFAQTFEVNMEGFLPYFHYIADEPPMYRRVYPVDSQNRAIREIPVSLDMLVSAAEAGRWELDYPNHKIWTSRAPHMVFAFMGVLLIVGWLVFLWR